MPAPSKRDIVDAAVAVRRGERDIERIADPTVREAVRKTARQLSTADLHVLAHSRIQTGRAGRRGVPIRGTT